MTRNIIVEFACSVYKKGEQNIPFGYKNGQYVQLRPGDFRQYPTVSGSVYVDSYDETLNSANIVLDHVKKEDRLIAIKSEQYVRVFDVNSWDGVKYAFDKLYLVDNYYEKEFNIKEHLFSYNIALMSETKLLEKWQCPNLNITHKINEDGSITKTTIYEYIRRYMELFGKKAKIYNPETNKWEYQPIIKVPERYKYENEALQNDYVEKRIKVLSDVKIKVAIEEFWVDEFPLSFLEIKKTTDIVNGERKYRLSVVNKTDKPISLGGWDFIIAPSKTNHIADIGVHYASREELQPNVTYNIFENIGNFDYIKVTHNDPVYIEYSLVADTDFQKKFDVPCVDMTITAPTLRQLLSTLMIQIGCIPTVKNRTLGYLDFNDDNGDFALNGDYSVENTVNRIEKSLSSDSYVNTLVNMPSNVLDNGNTVISERLGFRDSSTVLLRQTENLFIETKFPIYSIDKMTAIVPTQIAFPVYSMNVGWDYPAKAMHYIECRKESSSSTGRRNSLYFKIQDEDSEDARTQVVSARFTGEVYFARQKTKNISKPVGSETLVHYIEMISSPQSYSVELTANDSEKELFFDNVKQELNNAVANYAFTKGFASINYYNLDGNPNRILTKTFEYIVISDRESIDAPSHEIEEPSSVGSGSPLIAAIVPLKRDFTNLVLENSQRRTKETNFKEMEKLNNGAGPKTIEELSEFVYGTVGYSIGDTKIAGFSQVYNTGSATIFGWIEKDKTYFENILNFFMNADQNLNVLIENNYEYFKNLPILFKNGEMVNMIEGGEDKFSEEIYNPSKVKSLTAATFDITYKPVNSFNLSYVKSYEDIDIPIEQYDSGDGSAFSDFDRLSTSEQEKVDRVGNPTLSISQRITPNHLGTHLRGGADSFKPVIFRDNEDRIGDVEPTEYTIFKRNIAVNNYSYDVSYVGSQNAILKNYFTSIRTKYRAYQNVDYSQATLRKEKDLIYVRIGSDYFNGDDKIILGDWRSSSPQTTMIDKMSYFIMGAVPYENIDKLLYACEQGNAIDGKKEIVEGQITKNDLSIITNKNALALVYECPDNVGSGTYIANDIYSTEYDFTDKNDSSYKIGGVPQKWQIWDNESYSKEHSVFFINKMNFEYNVSNVNDTSEEKVKDILRMSAQLPIVSEDLVNPNSDINNIVLSVVDDNSIDYTVEPVRTRTFYKDIAERINHTVQFIYYTTENDIIWTERFIQASPFIQSEGQIATHLVDLTGKPFELDENNISDNYLSSKVTDFVQCVVVSDNGHSYLNVKWSSIPDQIDSFKVCTQSGHDIIAFKRNGLRQDKRYYVTLNDTKTDYVLSETSSGMLYRTHTVKKNTLEREVDSLFND